MKTNSELKALAEKLISMAREKIEKCDWYTEDDLDQCDSVTVYLSGSGYECYLYAYPYKKRTDAEIWNENNDHVYYNIQDYLIDYANNELETDWIRAKQERDEQCARDWEDERRWRRWHIHSL